MIVDQDHRLNRMTISQPAFVSHILRNSMFGDVSDAKPVGSAASNAKNIDHSGCPTPSVAAKFKHWQKKFRRDVGKLLYLARLTRPDICFAVNRLSQFVSNPGQVHFTELRWLLRYLAGTRNLGISYCAKIDCPFLVRSNAVNGEARFDLMLPRSWSDADWAGEATTRRSRSAFLIEWLGAALVWGSERQVCISLSTTEAELVAMSRGVQEVIFVRKLLRVFGYSEMPTFLFCDNKGALALVKNNVFHKRTKHIDIRYFFVRREEQNEQSVLTAYSPTNWMLADSLTKNVDEITTQDHRWFIMGMDLQHGKVVFFQVFHPKSRLLTPMLLDARESGRLSGARFNAVQPPSHPAVLVGGVAMTPIMSWRL